MYSTMYIHITSKFTCVFSTLRILNFAICTHDNQCFMRKILWGGGAQMGFEMCGGKWNCA